MTIDTINRPIFVYGTLRPNGGNHYLWRGVAEARYDDACFVVGYQLVHNGHFPYLIPAATAQSTGCLIYPTPVYYEDTLKDMDNLEGVPSHYSRITVAVFVPGAIVNAWTYSPGRIDDSYMLNLPDVAIDERGFYNWRLHMRSAQWT